VRTAAVSLQNLPNVKVIKRNAENILQSLRERYWTQTWFEAFSWLVRSETVSACKTGQMQK
jgi:hypothetical protein